MTSATARATSGLAPKRGIRLTPATLRLLPFPPSDTIGDDVRRARLFLVAAVLAFWMVPTGAAVVVGLHLLIDDHHDGAHAQTDGTHQHEVVESTAHAHDVVAPRGSSTARHDVATMLAPEITPAARIDRSGAVAPATASNSPPHTSLFLSHCSLLI